MPRKRRARTRDNILTGEEVQIVLDSLETEREELCVKGILFTGLRRGEFAHLTKAWIQRGKIQVPTQMECNCWECQKELWQKTKKKDTGEIVRTLKKPAGLWMPKTEEGARGIPLNPLSRPLFAEFFEKHESIREVVPGGTRSVYYTIHDIIYQRIKGQLVHELFPHVLRGVFASRLCEQEINPWKLKEIMGWKDIKVALWYVATYGPQKEAENLNMEAFVSVKA